MYAYSRPEKVTSDHEWIDWVFRLRTPSERHAVEFVERWNSKRIAIAGALPWLGSWLVGIIWATMGGDPQTTFTVAGFMLSSMSCKFARWTSDVEFQVAD